MSGSAGSSVNNLEKMIHDYAWQRYMKKLGFPRNLLARKNSHKFEFRWSHLQFIHHTEWTNLKPEELKEGHKLSSHILKKQQRQRNSPPGSTDNRSGTSLYSGYFENRTPSVQKYTFAANRQTTASTTVSFQENYTLGAKTNIAIKLPGDVVSMTAGLSGSLSVTESEGETFTETNSWNVDTAIDVKSNYFAVANLEVCQKDFVEEFEVTTTVVPEIDFVPITVKKKGNSEPVFTCGITKLKSVFEKYQNENLKVVEEIVEENGEKKKLCKLVLTSRGKISAIRWIDQQVVVEAKKLEDTLNASTSTDETGEASISRFSGAAEVEADVEVGDNKGESDSSSEEEDEEEDKGEGVEEKEIDEPQAIEAEQ